MYGIVVYPGMESKVMKSFKEGEKYRDIYFNYENKLFLLIVSANIIVGTIFGSIYLLTGTRY